MNRELFLSRLEEGVIIGDGAVGTLLMQKGLPVTKCKEEVNLTDPSMVEEIHSEYLMAGAQMITTNTFRANAFHLKEYNLEGKVREINQEAVRIARRANRLGRAMVGVSIGPMKAMLKPYGEYEISDIEPCIAEQVKILAECEPDLFILETQQSLLEVKLAIRNIRKIAPDIPIVASFAFSKEGKTYFGDDMMETLKKVISLGADVAGMNCALGPSDTAEMMEQACRRYIFPLSVMPNAGYPAIVKGKLHYLSSPEYMAEFAREYLELGVNIIGGCCGTTPAHVRKMAEVLKGKRPAKRVIDSDGAISILPCPKAAGASRSEKGFFKKLGKEFVISVEIDPPKGADCSQALQAAKLLKNAGVDAVNIAENPLAKVRISPMVAAHIIRNETGLSTILHLTCRDRNLLGLQSELLGASALGIEGVLALRGDPTAMGDFQSATSVNDVTAIGLVKVIKSLNNGLDFADNPVTPATNFRIGFGINPNARSLDDEKDKLKAKIDAGGEFGVTQPVFDLSAFRKFHGSVSGLGIPIMAGILPLRSLKHALFLKNEVAGIEIDDETLERMRRFETKEDQARCGIQIAREILDGLREMSSGAYIMPPFSRYEVVLDLLN